VNFGPQKHEVVAKLDSAKIRQVIDNLLSNAVKYSPPGSIITVTVREELGQCSFSVIDQGPGIPENERHKLFQDFGRLSAQPTGGEKSTGLGLAICRKIVEAHGGGITAENLPGRGSEFRVTLPLDATPLSNPGTTPANLAKTEMSAHPLHT
jgi:signal transduction histidine kinase